MKYKYAFLDALDARNIRYTDPGDNRVIITYSGDNAREIKVNVIFDKDGDGTVSLYCWSFGHIPNGKRAVMLEACNTLNKEYRWVKFYIDDDEDVAVLLDAIIDIDTAGDECIQLLNKMVGIYDDAYPVLMKASWA